MIKHQDESFDNETIALDGEEFRSCTFHNCRFTYSGGTQPILDRCSFFRPLFEFVGAAGETLTFLRLLQHGGLHSVVDAAVLGICSVVPPRHWGPIRPL
jgi:hypothetical protein